MWEEKNIRKGYMWILPSPAPLFLFSISLFQAKNWDTETQDIVSTG